MSGRRLKRQQSTISIYFEALSPRYFCCFGLCHAKTIGVFIFLFELITVIGFAAFLFILSAKYSTSEWKENSTLIVVAISLVFILLLASTTALLFFGVCYEKSSLILPYILRQVLYIISIVIFVAIHPIYFCAGIPFVILQLLLLVLALGSYRYFLGNTIGLLHLCYNTWQTQAADSIFRIPVCLHRERGVTRLILDVYSAIKATRIITPLPNFPLMHNDQQPSIYVKP